MPLSTGHPFLVEGPSLYTRGSSQSENGYVQRGLFHYVSGNVYTAYPPNDAFWPNQVLGANRFGAGWSMTTGPTRTTTTPGGMTALDLEYLSGTTDTSIRLVDLSAIALPSATVDIWFLLKSWPIYPLYMEQRSSPTLTFATTMYFSNSNLWVDTRGLGTLRTRNTSLIRTGRWHNACVTWTTTGCTGYVDGVAFESATGANTSRTGAFNQYVASAVNFPLTGLTTLHRIVLSTVKLYTVALDASEVRQNYNALAEMHGKLPIA